MNSMNSMNSMNGTTKSDVYPIPCTKEQEIGVVFEMTTEVTASNEGNDNSESDMNNNNNNNLELNQTVSTGDDDATVVQAMPARIIVAEGGDMLAAKERWRRILQWREENDIDALLTTPQVHYDTIKKCYPHYFHRLDKTGKYYCYYSQPGLFDMAAMTAKGVTMDDLIQHNCFIFEFMWKRANRHSDGKLVTVIDMKGLGFRQMISGATKQLLKQTVKIGSEYYPERTYKTLIVNVPTWFSVVWNLVKVFLSERSLKKISILRGNYKEELEALVNVEAVPVCFGGECENAPYGGALEVAMQEHVDRMRVL